MCTQTNSTVGGGAGTVAASRNPRPAATRGEHPGERDRRYLTALIGWGYKPSDVEQLVLADTTQTDTSDPDVPIEDVQQIEDADAEGERVVDEQVVDEPTDEPDQDGDDGD